MVNGDVPLIVCVTTDVEVRERVARRLSDCGAVLMCADIAELRALLDRSGHGEAPSGVGYSGAPVNGGYSGAPVNGGYSGAPVNGGYSGAPVNGGYSGAPVNGAGPAGSEPDLPAPASAPPAAAVPASTPGSVPPRMFVPPEVVTLGDLVMDPGSHLATWRGTPMPLTRIEWELLGSLATPPPAVWTYERLFGAVWGSAYLGDTSILHSAMKRLRRKLRDAGEGVEVETVRGVGYRLAVTR